MEGASFPVPASPAAVPGFKGGEGAIAPAPAPALLVDEGDGLILLKNAGGA